MLIVESGARADLGQLEAAVITLQLGLLDNRSGAPWVARLRSAYADALAAVGRDAEAPSTGSSAPPRPTPTTSRASTNVWPSSTASC